MSGNMPAIEEEFNAEKAAAQLNEGKRLIDDDPEKAVEVLCEVVQMFEKGYGRGALECAPAYLQYGVALYELARSTTDALGAAKTTVDQPAVPKPAATDEGAPSAPAANADEGKAAPPPGDSSAAAPEAKPADGQADAEAAQARGSEAKPGDREPEAGEDGDEEDGQEEGAEGEEEGAEGENNENEDGSGMDDMMLAWETLELARVVYTKNEPEKHGYYLADVYKGLGDIKAELEQFDDAVENYRQSIACLESLKPPPKRRLAEVQYTLSIVLTYNEQHEAALLQTRATLANLEGAVAEIEERLGALPTDGSGGEAAEQEGRRLQQEADDLRGVMAEVQLNMEGLQETIDNNNSLKEALRQAYIKATGGNASAAAATLATTLATTFNRPSTSASGSAPISLGVVGRGTKRISIQPVAAASGGQAQKPAQGGLGSAAAAPAAAGAPGKRTLADLMGGGTAPGAEAASGFGAVAVVEKRQDAQPQAKKARAEEAQGDAAPAAQGAPEAAEATAATAQ